ncbi:MAG TPA: amidase family protein, partial [Pseudonocardia sp.]|nr:amidase family protein [Pseudonocardia sp.]
GRSPAEVLGELGPDLGTVLAGEVGDEPSPIPAHTYARALTEAVPAVRRGFERALAGVDLLLTPATPAPAATLAERVEMQLNGHVVDTFATYIRYTFCVSIAGLPALSIPGGRSADGLPIGVQLVGPAWGEPLLIRAGHAFERLTTP